MQESRRKFLSKTSFGLLAVAAAPGTATTEAQNPSEQTPGAPPAFGTAEPVGPAVSAGTFTEAEKLVQVDLTALGKGIGCAHLGQRHGSNLRTSHRAA